MADPVAGVEKIVKLGLAIKEAVDTVRHNEEECREIRKRVLRFSAILSQLQQTGLMNDSPVLSGALEDLEESLQHALELVMACQERSTVRRLISAGELSKQLRRVKDDILNKVMLASFAINAHTTILLLTIQAGGHPLLRQQEVTGATEASHNRVCDGHGTSELNGGRNNVLAGSRVPVLEFQFHWSSLFRIIEGIAQGMHCLHKQGIIHMDMKPSNVLLDSDMNPKIIDFGISEVLNDNQITRENVSDIILRNGSDDTYTNFRGTVGYVAPEYLAEGIVSKKNDVYAFGITLIQIVGSIRRFKPPEQYPFDEWAWRAWESGGIEELFDPALFDESQLMEIKRCVEVGLLCAQHDPANRPTMEDVVQMLCGLKELPTPKKPQYMETKRFDWIPPDSPSALSDVSLSPR